MGSPLARVGALLVKQWSKETAVNLSMKGYWTTYCVNIVWIAFLIHKKIVKFVDPTTIPVYVTNEQFENEIFRYIPTLGSDDDDQQGGGKSILNDAEKIGNLLFEFFYYYGYEFDWSKNVVTFVKILPSLVMLSPPPRPHGLSIKKSAMVVLETVCGIACAWMTPMKRI